MICFDFVNYSKIYAQKIITDIPFPLIQSNILFVLSLSVTRISYVCNRIQISARCTASKYFQANRQTKPQAKDVAYGRIELKRTRDRLKDRDSFAIYYNMGMATDILPCVSLPFITLCHTVEPMIDRFIF